MPDSTVPADAVPRLSWQDQRAQAQAAGIASARELIHKARHADEQLDAEIRNLHDEHELTYAAIAEATGLSVSIVQSRCRRAAGLD